MSINKILTLIKGITLFKIDQKQCALDTTWILYLSMHIQNFIKIHPFVLKILRKNTFLHQSRAITLLFVYKFSPFAIPNHTTLISMSMQSLKKPGHKLLNLESGNDIFTSIKSHNSVEKFRKISCASHNTAYTKFHQNPSICSQDIKWKQNSDINQGP